MVQTLSLYTSTKQCFLSQHYDAKSVVLLKNRSFERVRRTPTTDREDIIKGINQKAEHNTSIYVMNTTAKPFGGNHLPPRQSMFPLLDDGCDGTEENRLFWQQRKKLSKCVSAMGFTVTFITYTTIIFFDLTIFWRNFVIKRG